MICASLLIAALGGSGDAKAAVRQLEGVININEASPDELRMISGIGPAKIRNILAYRRAHPFRTVEELVRIKGIGRKLVRRFRMNLATSGPTTARQVIVPSPMADPEPAPPAVRLAGARTPPRLGPGAGLAVPKVAASAPARSV